MTGKTEQSKIELQRKKSKEIIHSGHFMVSDFEAEGRDEDEEVAVPVPEDSGESVPIEVGINPAGDLAGISDKSLVHPSVAPRRRESSIQFMTVDWRNSGSGKNFGKFYNEESSPPTVTIDQSLTKLFQCMSLAYSHKLTSPRWKNFKGLRLQWKDKIRLNNVIWRCWHMQFVKRQDTIVCQFASPLDVDQHNKPEAVVLEGKYWKRKLATVTAEYKNWRIFYKNKIMGRNQKDFNYADIEQELNQFDWSAPRSIGLSQPHIGSFADDDFFMDFSDTLFSSLTSNQPFPFPNPREIARGAGLADFIQPGLVQLQPNLEDIMDMDPFHDLLPSRLPPVEEEIGPIEDISIPPVSTPSSLPQPHNSRTNDFSVSLNYPGIGLENITTFVPMDVSAEQNLLNLTYTSDCLQQKPMDVFGFTQASLPTLEQHGRNAGTSAQKVVQQPQQTLIGGNFAAASGLVGGTSIFDLSVTASRMNDTRPAEFLTPQSQDIDQQGFAVPRGTARSRSRSGSSLAASAATPLLNTLQLAGGSISASQPCLNNSAPQNGRPLRAGSPSTSYSPQPKTRGRGKSQAANSSADSQQPTPSTTGRGRNRSAPNPPPVTSLAAANTVPTHAVLPDNTLLAQLLTGNSGTSSTTALLLTNPHPSSRTSPQIPLLVPIATTSDHSAQIIGEKTVTLLAAQSAFTSGNESEASSSLIGQKKESPSPSELATNGKSYRPKENERGQYKEHRRVCHINAEQKRRCNIKNGFDTLQSLLPGLGSAGSGSSSGSSGHIKINEVSKAAMLHRGADYIRQLRSERQQQQEEMEQLRQSIDALNLSINECQAMLPATGVPISRQRTSRLREMFDEWVRTRTLQNWKFWIFSIIIQPLLESFSTAMASATGDDLCRLVLNWVDQHCSLLALRPAVLNSLRHLSKTTDILTDPGRLPAEATRAVREPRGGQGSS